MEKNDLQQIQTIVQQSIEKVWDDNIEPAFNGLNGDVNGLKGAVSRLENRITNIENKVAQLPTKSYLDDKLADLEGGLITKLRKEDQKMNRLVDMLKQKNVLNDTDLKELNNLQIFPY